MSIPKGPPELDQMAMRAQANTPGAAPPDWLMGGRAETQVPIPRVRPKAVNHGGGRHYSGSSARSRPGRSHSDSGPKVKTTNDEGVTQYFKKGAVPPGQNVQMPLPQPRPEDRPPPTAPETSNDSAMFIQQLMDQYRLSYPEQKPVVPQVGGAAYDPARDITSAATNAHTYNPADDLSYE